MKTDIENTASMIAQLRKIRDSIDLEIKDMTAEQVLEYYNNREGLLPKEVWNKVKEQKKERDYRITDSTKDGATVGPPRER